MTLLSSSGGTSLAVPDLATAPSAYPDVAKVIAIYESLGTGNPTLDTLQFTSTASVHTNAIIGENIIGSTSNAVARVVVSP